MLLRMLANVLPRQSVSFAITWSINARQVSESSRFHLVWVAPTRCQLTHLAPQTGGFRHDLSSAENKWRKMLGCCRGRRPPTSSRNHGCNSGRPETGPVRRRYRTQLVNPLKAPSLRQLRRYAIERSLFKATSLPRAIARLGFVQADPMRAPARAQDLILAQRVKDYRAGDLERRYPRLAIEEAFFINYGFLPRETLILLHPRAVPRSWDDSMQAGAQEVLAFVRRHGRTYPKDVQAHFDHGRIKRWGADLNVSSHLLEGLHYSGLPRVARREAGTRIYQATEHPPQDDG